MNKIYDITQLRVTQQCIRFELAGNTIQVPLIQTGSRVLPRTRREYLEIFEVDDDGIGIYWPVLDEDLSIEGLLRSAGREDLVVKHIPSIYVEEAPDRDASSTIHKEAIHVVA